jgi:hypothetical protein
MRRQAYCRGTTYSSVWHLQIVANRVTGTSEWDCCPGHRVDRLAGTLTKERSSYVLRLTRFCAGQGQPGSCQQVYRSIPFETTSRVAGDWSGTGGSGSWTLYVDRMDVKFTARAGDGASKHLLLDDAQLLGGGKAIDLNFKNSAERMTAVFALRLHYTGGPEVRASLRATDETQGDLENVVGGNELSISNLSVFQSNAPKGRTRYGCPQVGQRAFLNLSEQEQGDEVVLILVCGKQRVVHWPSSAVTLTPIHGTS